MVVIFDDATPEAAIEGIGSITHRARIGLADGSAQFIVAVFTEGVSPAVHRPPGILLAKN